MVKSPNLMAIRQKLPRGAVKQIAERTGLPVMTISNFFNHGWYPEHTTMILTEAIGIIKGSFPDDDLIEEIEELGLAGGAVFYKGKRKNPKPKQESEFNGIIIFVGLFALVFFLFKEQLMPLVNRLFKSSADKYNGINAG